jgi:hypothetical protein
MKDQLLLNVNLLFQRMISAKSGFIWQSRLRSEKVDEEKEQGLTWPVAWCG